MYANKKISNVVEENEKLKYQLDEAHTEIGRLRKQNFLVGEDGPKQHESSTRRRHSNPVP